MQKTPHSLAIIPVSASRLMERFAYYGMRSILVIYLSRQLGLSYELSAKIYSIFTISAALIPVIGGLVGDLLLGSRLSSITGGFIQALGCFALAAPNAITMYLGLFLVAFGSGLYSPNVLSMLASAYRQRPDKQDAAFTIFYICINFGAMLAPLIISAIPDNYNYPIAFIFSGIVMLGAPVMLLFSGALLKEVPSRPNIYAEEKKSSTSSTIRILSVFAVFILMLLFWRIYEMSMSPVYSRILDAENIFPKFSYLISFAPAAVIIPLGIFFILLFSFTYSSPFLKIAIGCITFLLSCALLTLSSNMITSNGYLFFVLAGIFVQSLAELLIAPITLSVISRYGSPKFSATLFGGFMTLSGIAGFASSFLYQFSELVSSLVILIITACIMVLMAGIFLTFYLVMKKKEERIFSSGQEL
jgi:POT family proton-dependent oligopeptide transporter